MDRVHVFASSAHHMAFENRDCCHCTKYSDDASRCEIMMALAESVIGDGTIARAMADRLRPTSASAPHCGEFERAESAAPVPPSE